MPHVSKHKVTDAIHKRLETHLSQLFVDTSSVARKQILLELYTVTERIMFAKRIGMLLLIDRHVPTHTISKLLRVSPSTVARFELAVERGKFGATLQTVRKTKIENRFLKILFEIIQAPFSARKESFPKLLERL